MNPSANSTPTAITVRMTVRQMAAQKPPLESASQ